MNHVGTYVPLVLIVAVFWLLILRPMRKRQQQIVQTQTAIEPGSQVMLASGIFGEIVSIDGEKIDLRIAPDVTVTVLRQAIARVEAPEQPEGM